MDTNKLKYNIKYHTCLNEWINIAGQDIEILKGKLHHPYTQNKSFDATQSELISFRNKQLITLDFGCGIGRNLSFLKKISSIVHGYDLPQMIHRCKIESKGYDALYDNWLDCIRNNYHLVSDCFSLQFIPDNTAVLDILNDIANCSNYFHIYTRNFIEDKHYTNIVKLILDSKLFNVIHFTHDPLIFSEVNFPRTIYGEFIFESKIKNRLQDIADYPKLFYADHKSPVIHTARQDINLKLKIDDDKYFYDELNVDIAFIDGLHFNISGSKYYNVSLLYMLLSIGYTVKWYMDTINSDLISHNFYEYIGTAIDNNILYKANGNISALDTPMVNCYIGTPGESALKALKLASKYHKPVYIIVYDCPIWTKKIELKEKANSTRPQTAFEYNTGVIGETTKYEEIKQSIHDHYAFIPQIRIITLTENSICDWASFFDLPQDHFISINPFINNKIRDKIQTEKKNQIICINRNCWNKALDETIAVFRKFSNDYTLHIITDKFDRLEEYMSEYNVNRYKIVLHTNISDADKFILLKESKLLISNSFFEGFGMWALEALSCGVPVVCYDLLSLENVTHPHLYKVPKFDEKQFETTMDEVLKKDVSFEPIKTYDFDYQQDIIKQKISLQFDNISAFTTDIHRAYEISTIFETTPVAFHFNSMYNIRTCNHLDTTKDCWNKILNSIQNNPYKTSIPNNLAIFTFSNKQTTSVLELSCNLQNIPFTKLGSNIRKWSHNDRIKFTIEYLESINDEYVLHVDALDAVIYGDLNQLFDYHLDGCVLFNAEEVCHPESKEIDQAQAQRSKFSIFKYLNGGVFFGKRLDAINVFKIALTYNKYYSPNPACDDCDQGKLNQVYVNHPELVKIDNNCRLFYCNDYKTNAQDWLRFNEL